MGAKEEKAKNDQRPLFVHDGLLVTHKFLVEISPLYTHFKKQEKIICAAIFFVTSIDNCKFILFFWVECMKSAKIFSRTFMLTLIKENGNNL